MMSDRGACYDVTLLQSPAPKDFNSTTLWRLHATSRVPLDTVFHTAQLRCFQTTAQDLSQFLLPK
jgi:hypothetical protein